MRHVMFSGAQSPGVIDLQSDFLWRELLFLFYPTNVSVTFTREPHECIAINADWLRWFVIRSLFSQWNASDFAHTVSLISDDWFVVFLLLWRWKNLKKGYPPCEVFKNHTNISLIKVIELQEHVVTNGGLEWQTVSTCFILKLYVEKFKKGACRSIKASVTPAWLWNANAFNFTAGGDSCQRSHWSRWREFLNSNFESLKLKTVLVLETFLNKQLRQPEDESVDCTSSPTANLPQSEGHPVQQWTPTRRQNTSCCLFAGHSFPLASPHLFNIFFSRCLFIYRFLPACGPKGWWNSERSAIYVGIIIWKWYSQATVSLRSSSHWIDSGEVSGSGGNRLSWMICFSFQARRVTSQTRPYLRVVSLL